MSYDSSSVSHCFSSSQQWVLDSGELLTACEGVNGLWLHCSGQRFAVWVCLCVTEGVYIYKQVLWIWMRYCSLYSWAARVRGQ